MARQIHREASITYPAGRSIYDTYSDSDESSVSALLEVTTQQQWRPRRARAGLATVLQELDQSNSHSLQADQEGLHHPYSRPGTLTTRYAERRWSISGLSSSTLHGPRSQELGKIAHAHGVDTKVGMQRVHQSGAIAKAARF